MRYFAITGRIPGADEDSIWMGTATNAQEAVANFVLDEYLDHYGEEFAREERLANELEWGHALFINHILVSDHPVEQVFERIKA